ncbi:hypothetical protein [Pleionea sediminis]|uniref:hypothetical protein n=1 Tax=Pleionea sediminis TaxID=2569479 RepID=UPI0011860706|nr:hypothetical protein [Pleionea sediminis]
MCNCKELPSSVVNISMSYAFRGIELQGVKLFPEYFNGLDSERFEPELSYEFEHYRCKDCGQYWYIFLDSDENPSPWFCVKYRDRGYEPSKGEIDAEKQFLTILAHNGFGSGNCRASKCSNLKLKGKELCHLHLSLP